MLSQHTVQQRGPERQRNFGIGYTDILLEKKVTEAKTVEWTNTFIFTPNNTALYSSATIIENIKPEQLATYSCPLKRMHGFVRGVRPASYQVSMLTSSFGDSGKTN